MVLKEDLPAMKDTAGRAGLSMRSSKDYLLCHQLDCWSVLLVLGLPLQDQECSVVAARFISHTPGLIALVVFTCVTYALHLWLEVRGGIRGTRVRCV